MPQKISRFLEKKNFKVKFCWLGKKIIGSIDKKDKKTIIKINLPLLITETFIHETLHEELSSLVKNLSEAEEELIVDFETYEILERMSAKEIKRIADEVIEIEGKYLIPKKTKKRRK